MKIKNDLDFMDDLTMDIDSIFNPITKQPIPKKLDKQCIQDTRFETGIIFCNEEKTSKKSLIATIIITTIIAIMSLLLFSLEIEIKAPFASDFSWLIIVTPQLIAVIILVIAIAVVIKVKR